MSELSTISSPEFRDLDPELALIPIGATEQHGPNLGMGIDYLVADDIAKTVADRSARRAVVCPVIPYGLSDHHMDFPGTITVSFDTLRSLCVDICESLHRHGVPRIVFVNGHLGNMHALAVICNELRFKLGIKVATAFWMDQASDVVKSAIRTKRWGHACEVECSLAMARIPSLVKTPSLAAGDTYDDYTPYSDRYEPYALTVPLSFAERTANGAFGDATQATAEVGTHLFDTAVERLTAFCDSF